MGRNIRFLLAVLIAVTSVSSLARAAGPPAVIATDLPRAVSLPDDGFDRYLYVYVNDAAGDPVPFPRVNWSVPATGPRAVLAVAEIGGEEEGMAAVLLRPVGGFGSYQLTASVDGLAPFVFNVTNTAMPLRVVSGDHQSTLINSPFPEQIVIEVRAPSGAPMSGVPIGLEMPTRGASATLDATSAITDANGRVAVSAIANGIRGEHAAAITAASVSNETIVARLSNLSLSPGRLSGGGSLELRIGGYSERLSVYVEGVDGLPLRSAAVQFSWPTGGATIGAAYDTVSGSMLPAATGRARLFTDANGGATIEVIANEAAGTYSVAATADGLPNAVTFTVTNQTRTAATIRANGRRNNEYAGEEAVIGARYERLRFRVADADGLALPNVTVTLTSPSSGPSVVLDSTTIVTGADGYAEARGTANLVPGTFFLRADVDGVSEAAMMYMVNMPPGYAVGEQLADISAFDSNGSLRSLRAFTENGRFLLLDVCTAWCQVCQNVQADGQQMKAMLAARGIDVALVPMLVESTERSTPSTQLDALNWRGTYGIVDPVLHASGDPASPVVGAGAYILGGDRPGYPTFLLVAPGGEIVANHRGQFADADAMVDFVSAFVPSSISVAPASVTETAGTVSITVSRSSGNGSASVSYATASASAGLADFTSRSGVVQFTPGETSATIAVPITNDQIDEPAEKFALHLSSPVNATIAVANASVTIVDDDAPAIASIADARFTEGTGAINTVKVPVQIDRVSGFPVTVGYRFVAGSAKSTDLTLTKGEVVIPAGSRLAYLAVDIVADKVVESKETFAIELTAPTHATLGSSFATVSIVDDDGDTLAPEIAAKSDVVIEVKMSASSVVVVDYKSPEANDKNDGPLATRCVAPSGSKFGYGSTKVVCSAEDKAGNLAERIFSVVVRLPTVAGAIFDPQDRTTPLTQADRGDTVLVHVNPNAFASRAIVELTLIDANGRRHSLGLARAGTDGSLDALVKLFPGATLGIGQVLAESGDASEYDRAWFLNVTKKQHD